MTANEVLHWDVTGAVDVSNPDSVCAAVLAIFRKRYRGAELSAIAQLFADFGRLYRGEYPGFFACDTQYHDMQHVLDVTLAAARFIDGYEAGQSRAARLGPTLAITGIAVALFHDSGYIRRRGDTRHLHGAEYTKTHVSRSARFLADYLPGMGLAKEAEVAAKLVHYTGYEFEPHSIELDDAKGHILGALIGSADVMAQMADRAYLEKCRDRLYGEFELGGVTREIDDRGAVQVRYASPADLLKQTPGFIRRTIDDRLEGLFGGIYRCVDAHFGGSNPYMDAVERNRSRLENLLAQNDERLLQRALLPA
jgi:hypothetical protein